MTERMRHRIRRFCMLLAERRIGAGDRAQARTETEEQGVLAA